MKARSILLITAVALGFVIAACASQPAGPAYPDKAVTIVVPFPPGGPGDQTARAFQEAIKPFFPQPLTIVNRSGGGGAVGMAEVVQSSPDGYTLGIGYGAALTAQSQLTQLPFKGPEDIQPIIGGTKAPVALVFKADAPWKTIKEFVDYAKANPEKARIGVGGMGTVGHLVVEMFMDKAGIKATIVPFEGAAPMVTAVLGGHVETVAIVPSAFISHQQAGTLKALVVAAEARAQQLPDVPTARESGYDVVSLGSTYFVMGPKGMPEKTSQTLYDAFKKAADTEAFKKFAETGGFLIDTTGLGELKKQLQSEYDSYGAFFKKVPIKI